VELGALGALTTFDESIGFDNEFGTGGRLGLFLNRMFSLEGNGDYTRTRFAGTQNEVNVSRIGGTLLAHANLAPWNAIYGGAGYEKIFFRGARSDDDSGPHVVLGDRLSVGGRAALRVEARGSYLAAGSEKEFNFSAAVGLSVYAFGGRMRDADGDLVGDKDDWCPDTPHGAIVDDGGCPLDTDRDLVFDGLDSCPDTQTGATVDAQGCPSDTDEDKVLDGIDSCPDTPVGASVDSRGCPLDGDTDGVFDGLDQCPDTPAGAEVNARGCPVDSDGDGVFDGLDVCPGTPFGVPVGETGCPEDSDADGVLDAIDQCPGTPLGTEVDDRGCEPGLDSDGDGVPDQDDRVNFETSRSRLTQDSYSILDAVAASLLEYPDVRVEVAGHTDATGTDAINNPLSLSRARAVMAYLARKGIPPERMEAHGYGSGQPIATNTTRDGRALNRRVELRVIEGGP
jgi:outer membrane protein OmpA-like peptidoglycan-associated protein